MLTLFASWDPSDLRRKRLKVSYEGEDGIDSGGLGKDFFASVAAALVSGGTSGATSGATSGVAGGTAKSAIESAAGNSGGGPRFFGPIVASATGCVGIVPGGGATASAWRSVGRFIGKALADRQLVRG